MDYLEELDSGTIERLGEQSRFLLGTYEEELAKDPASRATESSRSNVIALWHTISQIYGKTVARDVANRVNSVVGERGSESQSAIHFSAAFDTSAASRRFCHRTR